MSDPTPSHQDSHASGSHYQPSLGVVFIIVILFIGATFFMVTTITSSPSVTTTTAPSTTTTKPSAARVIKSRERVQVANGTSVTGLAATYTQKLMTQDWDTLPPVNGPTERKTIIYYNRGQLKAAQEVATTIHVSLSAIHPLDSLKPLSGAAGDDVIVILGHDESA
ncbi:MAG TPA: LytR C-terminal domain-containing protein [Acidimicrobiales bacterium]|jgi:Na+-transporting methylmalonyl-CoA/oxaloacetate decarboxylase gamma subunit|nr:LytR C-terminal domain-containing protein [Acidimicrobiales bacterium]